MSSRVRQVRLTTSTQEYATTNNIQLADETRITNFYLFRSSGGKQVSFNDEQYKPSKSNYNNTFTIVPDAIKTLYVPQIKINIL